MSKTNATFWDNAPIYTMHIQYGFTLICIGISIGILIGSFISRKWYKRHYENKLIQIYLQLKSQLHDPTNSRATS